MPTPRIRGAHRHPLSADEVPEAATGPRRWVVSLGVLGVVGAICGVGVFALGDGDGDSGQAATGSSPAATAGWTARSFASDDATAAPLSPTADDEASSDGAAGTGSVDEDGTGASVTTSSGAGSSSGGGTASGSWAAGGGASGTDGAGGTGAAGGSAAGGSTTAAGDGSGGVLPTDRAAGAATRTVVQSGRGRLLVVPGSVRAPSAAPSMRVRVEIEEGIGADGPAFAAFVLSTLNDSRSWGHGGTLTFARTDGPADFRVILASPSTSAKLCAPAQTRGTMSCGGGDKAVLTMYRWVNGIPDYGTDRTAYRRYLVNHEVGHVLGHSHAFCTPGHLAPVMVQQTKGLHGCLANSWPFP